MRPIAYKLKIEDLSRGEYRRSADGVEPSYFLTPWKDRITRARVMGTVVDSFAREDGSYATLRLDDGSGIIRVRAWGNDISRIDRFSVGDVLDVLGRVKEFEGEVYLTPEIVLPVEDPNWEVVRDLEILNARKRAIEKGVKPNLPPKMEPRIISVEMPTPSRVGLEDAEEPLPATPDATKDQMFLAIKEAEGEEGVTISDLVAKSKMTEAEVENVLRELLDEGKAFEPKEGRFKSVI